MCVLTLLFGELIHMWKNLKAGEKNPHSNTSSKCKSTKYLGSQNVFHYKLGKVAAAVVPFVETGS